MGCSSDGRELTGIDTWHLHFCNLCVCFSFPVFAICVGSRNSIFHSIFSSYFTKDREEPNNHKQTKSGLKRNLSCEKEIK